MKILLIIAGVVLAASGCSTTQVNQPVDLSEKTFVAGVGGGRLGVELKRILRRNGWTVTAGEGPSISKQTDKDTTTTHTQYNGRYVLDADSRQYDLCVFPISPALNYEITVFDTRTKEEVFVSTGQGCQSNIVQEFEQWLTGNKL